MYVGVIAIILGNTLILGNAGLFTYAAIIALGFIAFVMAYEEPTLRARFGTEYAEYCQNVPRFIPRLTPWRRGQ